MHRLYHLLASAAALNALFCCAASCPAEAADAESGRPAHTAGVFYPSDAEGLSRRVDELLSSAPSPGTGRPAPVVLFVPHAGYGYSGRVAAAGYRLVQGRTFPTVILIGPSHQGSARGVSIWSSGAWETPLGPVEVDRETALSLRSADEAFSRPQDEHLEEHSLEVQLPFLQRALTGGFRIVPIVTNDASAETRAKLAREVAEKVLAAGALVVISTDMNHYKQDAFTRQADAESLKLIEAGDPEKLLTYLQEGDGELCGAAATLAGMEICRLLGAGIRTLDYATSAEATGDTGRVVGYGALAASFEGLTPEEKKELLGIARGTLEMSVRGGGILKAVPSHRRLTEEAAVFVTLRGPGGALRGCIGRLEATQPLHEAVRDMTIASASEDPRFRPVTREELEDITIELSVLSVPTRVGSAEEVDPSEHGVIVRRDGRSGVFLPKVAAETGWDKRTLLNELCSQKAGLEAECWEDPRTEISVFTAYEVKEAAA